MNIKNSKYADDHGIIDDNSTSTMSKTFTKSYLHHLFKTKEILGLRIATEHNLYFYFQLMRKMRNKIQNNNFMNWSTTFIDNYEGNTHESY